jgi:hypothetical protein
MPKITRGRSKKAVVVLVTRDRQDLKKPRIFTGPEAESLSHRSGTGNRGNFDFPAIDHQKQIFSP